MKKTVFLLGFLSLSFIGFSQSLNANNNDNQTSKKAKLVALDKAGFKPAKQVEKIQTTVEGTIKHHEEHTPKYPTPMIEPGKNVGDSNQLSKNN